MADIITRLLLDTKNFDAKLEKSKSSVNGFQGGISGMAKTAGLGIGKLAGALGLAMGAGEAFNKVLNSSQTLGDMTARNMAALKNSVDEFFYSLGSGNLSNFVNGLSDIIDKSKEAYNALDQLGNTQISYGIFSAANQTKISEGQYIAKNKFAPINERLSGFEMWNNALTSQKAANEALQRELLNAATASVKSKITSDIDISLPDLMQAFETDLLNPLKRDETKATAKRVYNAHTAYANAHTDDAEAVRKDAESRKKYLVIHAMLEKYTDTELKAIAAQIQQYYQTTTALNSLAREYNETATEFNNSNKAAKNFIPVQSLEGYKVYTGDSSKAVSGGKTAPPPVGSIADLNKQISEKNQELINATTVQARIAVQTTINELEARKINLQIETDKGAFAEKYGENKLSQISSSEIAGISYNKGKDFKKDLKGKLPKYEPIFKKEDIDLNNDFADSLSGIGEMMGNLSGLFDENTASALQWGSTLLTAIAQATPAIIGMMGIKEQDTLTTNANTTAEVANAGAKAMSAHSGIPFVGIALGLAGVAAIVAAMSSMPHFATGGIVPGTSFTGDKVPALLNSGEMILNGSQQNNLFRLLNSGMSDSLGAKIAPFAGSNEIRLSSDIAIKGDTLYLALNNYMKRTGKKL